MGMWEWGWLAKCLIVLLLLNVAHLVLLGSFGLKLHLQKKKTITPCLFLVRLTSCCTSSPFSSFCLLQLSQHYWNNWLCNMDFSKWMHLDLFWGNTMVTLICRFCTNNIGPVHPSWAVIWVHSSLWEQPETKHYPEEKAVSGICSQYGHTLTISLLLEKLSNSSCNSRWKTSSQYHS